MFLAICISVILWISIWFFWVPKTEKLIPFHWVQQLTDATEILYLKTECCPSIYTLYTDVNILQVPTVWHVFEDKPSWLLFQFAHSRTGRLPQKYTRESKTKRKTWLKVRTQPAQPPSDCPAPITTASVGARGARSSRPTVGVSPSRGSRGPPRSRYRTPGTRATRCEAGQCAAARPSSTV